MLVRTETGYLLQSDNKLLQCVVHELGLEKAKPATLPGITNETDRLSKPLRPEEHLPGQGLCSCAVKELSWHLQDPSEQSWGKLKRLGRYPKGHRESSLRFELTSAPEVLNRWVMLIGEAKGLIRGVRLAA